MTLLAVERIKLFTTRSPWWCTAIALFLTIGFTTLITAASDERTPPTVASTQFGANFGMIVVMVMAALAITTEYRFGTIRATFQAVPKRTSALLAKTTVVAILALIVGELAAFGSWGVANLLKPTYDLAINTSFEWRTVAGQGLVYAVAAVIAVAVGTLIRQSAGALSVLLIYVMLVENLVSLIPGVGENIQKWLPFTMAQGFLSGNPDVTARSVQDGPQPAVSGLDPWGSLAYFAAFAAVLMIIALATANKRDA